MRRLPAAGLALCLAAPLAGQEAGPATPPGGVPVARLAFVEGHVERAAADGRFKGTEESAQLRTGDRLRTGPDGLARLSFPWMTLTLAPASTLFVPSGIVLATGLEAGRIELASQEEIIKVVTAEARIRGGGRGVIRRQDGRTLVMCLSGRFRVEPVRGGASLTLGPGRGTSIVAGQPPRAVRLAASPTHLLPGSDAVYARPGQPVPLKWRSDATAFHLQVLPIDGEEVVLERDVGAPPQNVEIPFKGLFRWRVASRGPDGLESLPSAEGLICVVDG